MQETRGCLTASGYILQYASQHAFLAVVTHNPLCFRMQLNCYPCVSSAVVCVSSLQAEQLMKRIGVEGVKLTEYEMNIASHLVDPQTMKVTVVILIHDSWYWDYEVLWHFYSFYHCTSPHSTLLQVSWRDIAGLDEVINELQDTVILPFQKRHLLTGSKLFQPPKGTAASHPIRAIMVKPHTQSLSYKLVIGQNKTHFLKWLWVIY